MSRVAFVAHWDWVLVNYQLSLAKALRQQGHEVVFICPPGQYVEVLQSTGFQWLPWRIERMSLNPLKEFAALLRLIILYREIRPEIAHHFTIKPNIYGSIAAWCSSVPLVFNAFLGLGYIFSDFRLARLLRCLLVPIMRGVFASQRAHMVFENEEDRHAFERDRVVARDRMTVIPAGVDTERFRPRRCRDAGDVIVLFAGRLLEDKGVGEFVEAARDLQRRVRGVQFWVAGDPDLGNPACIPRDTLASWEKEGSVRLLGHCSQMEQLLREVDIAVLPSYHEGFPRFLLEAAATGLPIVATDVEGCRMVVRDEENGLLVPPRDARELAGAIGRLLEDPSERRRMGESGRRSVERNFSEEKVVGQHLELYRRWTEAVFGSDRHSGSKSGD